MKNKLQILFLLIFLCSCNKSLFNEIPKPTIENVTKIYYFNLYNYTKIELDNSKNTDLINEFSNLTFSYIGEGCKCASLDESISFQIDNSYYTYSDIFIRKSDTLDENSNFVKYNYQISNIENFYQILKDYFNITIS